MSSPTVRARCRACRAWIDVSPFAPQFPAGPFYCAPCAPRTRREGAAGTPDDDAAPLAADEETSTDALVIDVSGRFGK